MNIPTREEVEQLWDEYHVPAIIRRHCTAVARVGVFLAKKLKEKGIHVDVGLVERACLLHDLARSANFSHFEHPNVTEGDIEFWKQMKAKFGHIHHGDVAGDILQDKYPEIAEVIRAHTIDNEAGKDILAAPWESRLLVYADLIVVHDKIKNLAEREKDSEKRHGNFFDKLKKDTRINFRKRIFDNGKAIEKQIFDIINAKPEDVNDTIADI